MVDFLSELGEDAGETIGISLGTGLVLDKLSGASGGGTLITTTGKIVAGSTTATAGIAVSIVIGGVIITLIEAETNGVSQDRYNENKEKADSYKEDSETNNQPADKTPKGREYTQHGAERANERGFDSQKIDSIIDNNFKHRTKEIDKLTGKVTWRYQDKRGNTVITNEWGDKIVTVYSHPTSANGGNYIPKN